jgi:hypothetical protein
MLYGTVQGLLASFGFFAHPFLRMPGQFPLAIFFRSIHFTDNSLRNIEFRRQHIQIARLFNRRRGFFGCFIGAFANSIRLKP